MKLSVMKLGMIACCTVMFIPLAAYFVAGGSFALNGGTVAAALPIVACLAVHGVMFAVLGKSCHGSKKDKSSTAASPTGQKVGIPVAALTNGTLTQ